MLSRFGSLHQSGRLTRVALKEVSLTRAEREPISAAAAERLRHEAEMLTKVQGHTGVLQMIGLVQEDHEEGTVLSLITEECSGGACLGLHHESDAVGTVKAEPHL